MGNREVRDNNLLFNMIRKALPLPSQWSDRMALNATVLNMSIRRFRETLEKAKKQ